MSRIKIGITTLLLASLFGRVATATVLHFDTVRGAFDVRIFDQATPITAQNIINYADDGDYVDSFIHRSVPGFVIQGGGFIFDPNNNVVSVPTDPPIMNEPGITNLRGTISMAKLGGDPDSATSQWFFSLANNSENLDNQNGGFTVFGIVLGDGMQVIDDIASLQIVNAGGAFNTLPVQNLSGSSIGRENLIIINSVTVSSNPAGDFNRDGTAGSADLSIWEDHYNRLDIIEGDLDNDFHISTSDGEIIVSNHGQFDPFNPNPAARTFADYTDGDLDGDTQVNGSDFLIWQQRAGTTHDASADADGDVRISGLDFLLWQQTAGTSAPPALASVPEPSTLCLLLLTAPACLRRRRR